MIEGRIFILLPVKIRETSPDPFFASFDVYPCRRYVGFHGDSWNFQSHRIRTELNPDACNKTVPLKEGAFFFDVPMIDVLVETPGGH